MYPILELLLNPFAGSGFNGIACMFYAAIVICIAVALLERNQPR